MQKQLFYTADPTEFEKYFFEDKLLDFPKYLTFLQTYLESKDQPIEFIQAFVHLESIDGEKEDVLTVETVFLEQAKFLRIWGVKDLESDVALKVTVELINPDTKQTEAEYTVIDNGEEFFRESIPEQ
ncbi:hypothetical protein [Niallia sp. Krafla_26]|uniref:hypothetical protein n=1 Tax=Niallia sp. Krafla_26 TaxID=3064703 RepID=UPI003D17C7C2